MSTVPELVAATRITTRQLNFWINQGHIIPDPETVAGSGYTRTLPDREAKIAKLMIDLIDGGLTLKSAADIARRHVQDRETEFSLALSIFLVIDRVES